MKVGRGIDERGAVHYQVVLILERVVQVGDPSAVAADEHVALLVEARRLRPLQHHPLVEDLHGVHALRVTQFHDAHLAERAPTDHLDDLEVVPRQAQVLYLAHARFH